MPSDVQGLHLDQCLGVLVVVLVGSRSDRAQIWGFSMESMHPSPLRPPVKKI